MQGIEILNKEPVMMFNDRLVAIAFILIGIALIWGYIATKVENEVLAKISIYIFGLCLLSASGVAMAYKGVKIPSGRYQYEAVIQDDVSINEVYEHYKVIDRKGKIWILEDKESAK